MLLCLTNALHIFHGKIVGSYCNVSQPTKTHISGQSQFTVVLDVQSSIYNLILEICPLIKGDLLNTILDLSGWRELL